QLFFGRGIVATPEDFGTQGELPTHPELLDWLAIHFRETGWDWRALCREIVLSSTYRQSTLPKNPVALAEDPENRWLGRGPRQRLSAEQLRDQALSVAGLLSREIGGPSVKPYQPHGIWEESGTQHTYRPDTGVGLYRRSLYTFWRRTMPPANLAIFDAPSREYCQMRRVVTSTPQQLLAILNDVQFVEASRCLAENLVAAHPDADTDRAADAFRRLTGLDPDAGMTDRLAEFIKADRAEFSREPERAKDLIAHSGSAPTRADLDPVEVAATTAMVRALFAYDGAMSKR
ncbi:MAG: DUF1553 domain-containing protein, partial [Verrucomicrobiae bacterium]|nr:DUF1553 domain-containing protein [Verrucomicrobiae bacterium]